MTETDISLWKQMQELTAERCQKTCKLGLGACCDGNSYLCELALEDMQKSGEPLPASVRDSTGRCQISPHFRPLCTLHQCDICGLGFAPDDPNWTQRYFDLRIELERRSCGEENAV